MVKIPRWDLSKFERVRGGEELGSEKERRSEEGGKGGNRGENLMGKGMEESRGRGWDCVLGCTSFLWDIKVACRKTLGY